MTTEQTIRLTVAREAVEAALAGCGITGGTLCAHIEPGTTHHGTPGRILAEGERCPLLTEQDLEGLAAALLGHYPRWQGDSSVWTGPRVAEIAGTARAARKHWAGDQTRGDASPSRQVYRDVRTL